jgi:mannose-6-phosphate isomerase-like protein (cupin superfamily)
MFYVLEGALTLRLGDETVEAPAGSFAFVPPGNVHTFSNPSDETVRMLNLMAPGGFEQYLKEAAAAMGGGPPDPAVMARIASRYDFEPVE